MSRVPRVQTESRSAGQQVSLLQVAVLGGFGARRGGTITAAAGLPPYYTRLHGGILTANYIAATSLPVACLSSFLAPSLWLLLFLPFTHSTCTALPHGGLALLRTALLLHQDYPSSWLPTLILNFDPELPIYPHLDSFRNVLHLPVSRIFYILSAAIFSQGKSNSVPQGEPPSQPCQESGYALKVSRPFAPGWLHSY